MHTTLPDLPYATKGLRINSLITKSSALTTPRSHPRTDLKTFRKWDSFKHDIDAAICSAMQKQQLPLGMPLTVGNVFNAGTKVRNEEDLRSHVHCELNPAVEDVLARLGVIGDLESPGGGNKALIGDPDMSYISTGRERHPKLVGEYTTAWVADLQDLPTSFHTEKWMRSRNQKQSVEALEQLYGYITFNNNRYGVLSNWTQTWVVRRVETDDRKTLEYAGPFSPAGTPSLLKVFVGMILLAEKDWFYPSPSLEDDPPPPCQFFSVTKSPGREQKKAIENAGDYNAEPLLNGSYRLLPLDFHLCYFILSSARHSDAGCVVLAALRREVLKKSALMVMCKCVDALQNPTSSAMLQTEARMYGTLRRLQGVVIPKVYGYYEVWGILHLLALEPVGEAITGQITQSLRKKMKVALSCLHSAGYVHGDISSSNFCERGEKVYIVDLETCRQSNDLSEMKHEMELIDSL